MKYRFYTTSETAWNAMLKEISRARKSIYLEMYILGNDFGSYGFLDILKEKALSGVRVKIIVDLVGSFDLDAQSIKEARAAGIELLFFSYWLERTHKKILIIDERIAFLGGVNIHKIFRKWNDLQVCFRGAIVHRVLDSFARTYQRCGGADPELLRHINEKSIIRKARIWILEHWQLKSKRFIKRYYRQAIQQARKSIVIVTPYFVPSRWLVGELHQALLRGVRVEVLLPGRTDRRLLNRVNYFHMARMHELGVKFYLQKEMNHAKAMLIDDTEGVVGSQNIDPLSFDYNLEIGAVFRDKSAVADLKKIVDGWKGRSEPFRASAQKTTWFDHLLAWLIGLLA